MSAITSVDDGLRILSLDDGGLNCISELKILDEFMQRLSYDTGKTTRPCEYFHSITGVGASGVIAIMLGVLGLSIDFASVAFLRICKEISLGGGISPQLRSEKLIAASRILLQELGVPEETRLRGELSRGEECKVSIPYMSAVNMTNCRMLRSYESRHSSYNPTILEAIRISWATPGLFETVRVGAGHTQEEELISAVDGYSNPTLPAIKEVHEAFGKEKRVCLLLSLGSGRPLLRSLSVDEPNISQKIARDTESTADQLKRRYSCLHIYFRLSVDRNLEFHAGCGMVIQERLAIINSHTSAYLETQDASDTLDRCIGCSRQARYVTTDLLYRTRGYSSTKAHGLPPLSTFYVDRKRPMDEITNALKTWSSPGQRVAVVAGMSGSGKTQVSLKYAYANANEYDHVLFVDASSIDSIQNGFLNRVRVLDPSLNPTTPNEAIQLLAQPQGNISSNWLVIMDNADDLAVELKEVLPACDFGAILITTRNPTLGNLSPDGLISLDVMSREESIGLLLFTALGRTVQHTNRDHEQAAEIVELLGYLPVAIVQAGCYIKQQKCLADYANRLRANPAKILRKPAQAQRDTLKYDHSVYAAFDTTLSVLSPLALKILGIISFVHFTDFPCPLFRIAASYGFAHDPHYLLDRPAEYQQSVDLLRDAFYRDGNWDEEILESVLEELQQYSMVTLVPVQSIVTLRLHPLVHSWAKDRLSAEESAIFRAAAVRLLVCGTDGDNEYIWEYLLPHLSYLSLTSGDIHSNDRAALALIVRKLGSSQELVKIWEKIHHQVQGILGEHHMQTTRAALGLADAYGADGDHDKMERMERYILELRSSLVGVDNLETSIAMENLARTLYSNSQYTEARDLQEEVLRVRRQLHKGHHRDLAEALCQLAITYRAQAQYKEAITLLQEALKMVTSLLGSAHTATIAIMGMLSTCYSLQGDASEAADLKDGMTRLKKKFDVQRYAAVLREIAVIAQVYHSQKKFAEAESQWTEVLAERRELLGEHHVDTLHTLRSLAAAIFEQGRYAEAQALWTEELRVRREIHGNAHPDTLKVIFWLARVQFAQGKHAEAERLWREELESLRKMHKNTHVGLIYAIFWLARAVFEQGRYEEAEALWREELSTRLELNGNEHEDTLLAKFWLGRAIFAQGRHGEAEILWQERLEQQRILHEDTHEKVLYNIFWLARAIFEQGRHAEAAVWWKKEIKGLREAHEDKHEEIAYALFWLARATFEQAQFVEAEEAWGEYIASRKGANHDKGVIYAYFWLARALFEQGKYVEAETLWRKEIDLQRQEQADIREETLDSSFWLAKSVFKQRRYAEAETIWRKDVEQRRGALQGTHIDTLHWQGRSLYAQERYEDAEKLWWDELSSRRSRYGDQDPHTLCTLSWLARAIFEQQKYEEAEGLWREELTARREIHGYAHEDTVHASFWLAQAIFEQSRPVEAEELWRKAVGKRPSIDWNSQSSADGKPIVSTMRGLEHKNGDSWDVVKARQSPGNSVPNLSIVSIPQPQGLYSWFQRLQQPRSPGRNNSPKPAVWDLDIDP